MTIFAAGPLFSPVRVLEVQSNKLTLVARSSALIMGGFITENLGWRWVFYLILILVSFFASTIRLSNEADN